MTLWENIKSGCWSTKNFCFGVSWSLDEWSLGVIYRHYSLSIEFLVGPVQIWFTWPWQEI